MPRTNINAQDASVPGFRWSLTGLTLTANAADATNLNSTAACNRLLVIARNTGGTTRTVTITSSPESKTGRTGHATVNLAGGATWCHVITRDGWIQDGGVFHFEAAHADVVFSLVKLE